MTPSRLSLATLWPFFMLVVLGLNLRPIITSPGPLLPALRELTGMSFGLAALITSVAVMMFGVVGLYSGRIINQTGYRHGVGIGLLAITMAALMRLMPPATWQLLGSAWLGGIGIALLQIIIPEVTKSQFKQHLSAITGLWSAALMAGAALGAVLSPWLASVTHPWYAGMSWWAILAVVGALCWYLPATKLPTRLPPAQHIVFRPHQFRRSWRLGLDFALINGGYEGIITWLAQFYQEFGWSPQQSGNLLAFFCALQVIGALLLPALARTNDRRRLLLIAVITQLIGFSGLMLAPQLAPWVWAGACGFGLGASFPLAIVGALDHLESSSQAGRLAAFMQGVGFLFAAATPFLTGLLRDITMSHTMGWLVHVIMALVLLGLSQVFNPLTYRRAFTNANESAN